MHLTSQQQDSLHSILHQHKHCSAQLGNGRAGEGQQECLNLESGGCGVATSVARDLLDATDLHFPMEDTSVLE